RIRSPRVSALSGLECTSPASTCLDQNRTVSGPFLDHLCAPSVCSPFWSRKTPVYRHQRQADTITFRLVNRVGVIRSSPLAGLCYDTPSVEVVLFPGDTPDKSPWALS